MTIFVYTATDSVAAGHAEGQSYTVEFDVQRATPKRTVSRNVAESLSGVRETLKHFGKRSWAVQLAPIAGARLPLLDEFLDSIEDGQTVQMYLYGTEAQPVEVVRTDEGHSYEEFMGVGAEAGDLFQPSAIELREV